MTRRSMKCKEENAVEIHYYRDAHDTAKHIETVENVQWVDGFAMPSG